MPDASAKSIQFFEVSCLPLRHWQISQPWLFIPWWLWSLAHSRPPQSWPDHGTSVWYRPAGMLGFISSFSPSFSDSCLLTTLIFLGRTPPLNPWIQHLTATTSPSVYFPINPQGHFQGPYWKLSVMRLDTRLERNGISPLILKRESFHEVRRAWAFFGRSEHWAGRQGEWRVEICFIYQMTSQWKFRQWF